MSSLLGINATLELLDRLRKTVQEFAAHQAALEQTLHVQRGAEAVAFQTDSQERVLRLADSLATADQDLSARRQTAQAQFQKRDLRIAQACKNTRKSVLAGIEQSEGRQTYGLQKRRLQAERQRDADLANTTGRLEQFRQDLLASEERFASLESAAYQAFSGAAEFRRLLAAAPGPEAEPTGDEDQLLGELGRLEESISAALARFRRNGLVALFRALPLWLLISAAAVLFALVAFALPAYQVHWLTPWQAAVACAGFLAVLFLAYVLSKRLGRPLATAISSDLAKARQWHSACAHQAEERYRRDREQIQANWETTNQKLNEAWQKVTEDAEQQRAVSPKVLDEKKSRIGRRSAEIHSRALERLDREHQVVTERLRSDADAQGRQRAAAREAKLAELEQDFGRRWGRLEAEWQGRVQPIWDSIQSARESAQRLIPPWADTFWQTWTPPESFVHAARFGSMEISTETWAGRSFQTGRLRLPGPGQFDVPLLLTFPEQGSLLLETSGIGAAEANGAINSILYQLLALAPPGKLKLTIFDPVGLGQSFAGLMHLADYEDSQISRIWTQTSQFEERLAELNDHMEKVIQMYLRNEYPTLTQYNAHAGSTAEKYQFLVVAGFPAGFSETASRRLLSIAASGARCGVYTLIHWDHRHELPHGFIGDELRKNSIRILAGDTGFKLEGRMPPGSSLVLETPPEAQFATEFLRKVGQSAKDSSRVELPFTHVSPSEKERWTADTGEELRVPIGRSGAAKLQYLALGKGTRQHALIAGKTGSGKSTLFHIIITNTALWCSPDQVEFYLVDFKKGVEFKCYANHRLPHARVVAIESDREFGLSVLQRVDDELRRRGDLFRKADVQDLAGYRKARTTPPLPRVLLLIDEFQEFFTEEDRISQAAAVLLDRVVRQGRAFGIHVLLGSQTLGGAYSLARATIGQMVVRIALQSNEADAYLIMDENNAAPRLLSRPGEGIYNDAAGALAANSPFQTAWLDDQLRDQLLAQIRAQADQRPDGRSGPIVFEGNAPADLAENQALQDALASVPTVPPPAPRVWLGAPNSIKGPTEVIFQRQSGSNLLIVGQSEDAAMIMPAVCLRSLAAQYPPGTVRLILLENTAPGTRERSFFDHTIAELRHAVVRPRRNELAPLFHQLAEEVRQGADHEPAVATPATFLLISSLQDFKPLRQEDEFSFAASDPGAAPTPAAGLLTLLSEGPSRGFHLIASVDSYSNVARFFGRKGLSEFQTRVLFQMSPGDSASLIDNPEAAKLGLHRALLYNEREGYVEKFRPYAVNPLD